MLILILLVLNSFKKTEMCMNKEMDVNDLFWLIGLLDGDGCFTLNADKPQISLEMVDEDIVKRVAGAFGNKYWRIISNEGHQDTFKVCLTGKDALTMMNFIKPNLSLRRQDKIDFIQSHYNQRVIKQASEIDIQLLKQERENHTLRSLAKKYNVSYETIRRLSKKEPLHISVDKNEIMVTGSFNEIHWIAGILEGEGSFLKGPPSAPNKPVISLQMTDKDTIEKCAKFFGVSVQSYQRKGLNQSGKSYKEVYMCLIRGRRAVEYMNILSPLMGVRRKQQICDAISSYNPNRRKEYMGEFLKSKRKISSTDIYNIQEKIKNGDSMRTIAKVYGVSHSTISSVSRRKI